MRKKIRPAEEEIGNVLPLLLFSLVWYAAILGNLASSGFHSFMVLFLVAGILPLYTAANSVRRALFYRRQRADAIALGRAQNGKITGVTRQVVPYRVGRHQTLQYQRTYLLQVEVYDPDTGIPHTVESRGYRKPIHRYLASDRVKVYSDRSGWKYYLEDFQWKEHRSDPGIFNGPQEYEEMHLESGMLGQILFMILLLLMLYEICFAR